MYTYRQGKGFEWLGLDLMITENEEENHFEVRIDNNLIIYFIVHSYIIAPYLYEYF
jgi:hypothetical protein